MNKFWKWGNSESLQEETNKQKNPPKLKISEAFIWIIINKMCREMHILRCYRSSEKLSRRILPKELAWNSSQSFSWKPSEMSVQSYTEKIITLLRIKSCSKINLVMYNVWAGFFTVRFFLWFTEAVWFVVWSFDRSKQSWREQSLTTNIQRNKISKECIFL